jgi:hypothetical protein
VRFSQVAAREELKLTLYDLPLSSELVAVDREVLRLQGAFPFTLSLFMGSAVFRSDKGCDVARLRRKLTLFSPLQVINKRLMAGREHMVRPSLYVDVGAGR